MNTATALSVRMGSDERRVILENGEAVFRVRHDHGRAFVVRAGDREVRDLGTVFDVLRHGGITAVAVSDGQVAVAPATRGDPVILRAGERLTHTEGTNSSEVERIDPKLVTAWQSGYLIYRNAPLRDVIADLNRYFRVPIVLEGAGASTQHFSGVLVIRDEDAAVAQLTAFLPVVAVRDTKGIIRLQSAKPKP